MSAISKVLWAVLGIALAPAAIPSTWIVRAQDQPEPPAFQLRAEYLERAGLHFPSYMPTVLDVMKYHVTLSAHQELMIEWNLIPGVETSVPKERVAEGSLAPNFSLLERKQSVSGNAGNSTLTLNEMTLVTAAVTGSGEIRGLTVGPGSPMIRAERGSRNGRQSPGHDFVFPKKTFILFLPNDPKIEKLVFLLAHPDGEKYRLEQVGTLELPQRRPTQ
jgi:hypothetical protein